MFLFYYKYSVEIGGKIMSVNSVTAADTQYVTTYQPVNVKEYPDRYIYTYEEPGTTGKKIGVGVASYFVPGLGQAINGQWGKAAGFFAGINGGWIILGSTILAPLMKGIGAIGRNGAKTTEEHMERITKLATKNMVGVVLGSLALAAVNIWGIVDAVKNAKSKRDIVVMKEPQSVQQFPQPAIAEAQT